MAPRPPRGRVRPLSLVRSHDASPGAVPARGGPEPATAGGNAGITLLQSCHAGRPGAGREDYRRGMVNVLPTRASVPLSDGSGMALRRHGALDDRQVDHR